MFLIFYSTILEYYKNVCKSLFTLHYITNRTPDLKVTNQSSSVNHLGLTQIVAKTDKPLRDRRNEELVFIVLTTGGILQP